MLAMLISVHLFHVIFSLFQFKVISFYSWNAQMHAVLSFRFFPMLPWKQCLFLSRQVITWKGGSHMASPLIIHNMIDFPSFPFWTGHHHCLFLILSQLNNWWGDMVGFVAAYSVSSCVTCQFIWGELVTCNGCFACQFIFSVVHLLSHFSLSPVCAGQ